MGHPSEELFLPASLGHTRPPQSAGRPLAQDRCRGHGGASNRELGSLTPTALDRTCRKHVSEFFRIESQRLGPKLTALGYEFVYFDGLSRFYVSRDHRELIDSFGPGPNVFDDFVLSGTTPFCRNLSEKLAQQQMDAQRLELWLRGLYASRSWRFTKPLRIAGQLARRVRDAGIRVTRKIQTLPFL